jgi:hypothetical protein
MNEGDDIPLVDVDILDHGNMIVNLLPFNLIISQSLEAKRPSLHPYFGFKAVGDLRLVTSKAKLETIAAIDADKRVSIYQAPKFEALNTETPGFNTLVSYLRLIGLELADSKYSSSHRVDGRNDLGLQVEEEEEEAKEETKLSAAAATVATPQLAPSPPPQHNCTFYIVVSLPTAEYLRTITMRKIKNYVKPPFTYKIRICTPGYGEHVVRHNGQPKAFTALYSHMTLTKDYQLQMDKEKETKADLYIWLCIFIAMAVLGFVIGVLTVVLRVLV